MGKKEATHDDHGTLRDPQSNAEWDEWVSASATRNHMMDDPLLDWIDRFGESNGFERDPVDERTDFSLFIFRKGDEFERNVLQYLRESGLGEVRAINTTGSSGPPSRDLGLALATWEAMAQGVPIIYQGVLRDPQNQTYGMPDLLVRSDVLVQLFPSALSGQDAAVAAPDLGIGDRHYVVVDIKYTTLKLTTEGRLSNSGSRKAYKAQLHIYNRALGRMQGYLPPTAFLLGRGWAQTVKKKTIRIDDCMDRLAPVKHEENVTGASLSKRADAATDWIRRMCNNGDSWVALPQPSVDELRPNAKGEPGSWAGAVRHIVEQGGDLTALYKVGTGLRRKANSKGLFDWRDEGVTPAALGIKGSKTASQLQRLLDVNRNHRHVVAPADAKAARSSWIDTPPLEFYVDFETVSDVNDDFSSFPKKGGQPLVFMVGCGHIEEGSWRFECFTTDQLLEADEATVIEQWLTHMSATRDRLDPGGDPRVYHWSTAEDSTFKKAHNSAVKRHSNRGQRWGDPNWFDFLGEVVREEPVVVRGAHGFGLKAMTNALHEAGLVQTKWQTGPADGLGAMIGAWWCQNEVAQGRAHKLLDLDLMQEIRAYNEVDCKAMMEIVYYLREHH